MTQIFICEIYFGQVHGHVQVHESYFSHLEEAITLNSNYLTWIIHKFGPKKESR